MSDDRLDDIDERMLVLRDKAAREGFAVPADVLDYIAAKYALPQTLKGALINVQAYASRRDIPVDLDVARLVLDGIRPAKSPDSVAGSEGTTPLSDEMEPLGAPFREELPEAEVPAFEQESPSAFDTSLEDELVSALGVAVHVEEPSHAIEPEESLFVVETPESAEVVVDDDRLSPAAGAFVVPEPALWQAAAPGTEPWAAELPGPTDEEPATVWFAPVRTTKKESLVTRAGRLLGRAGLHSAIADGDLVAVKLHFGEEGNTGFVHPVFLREVVRLVREAGGKPFLTDCNTLYRGQRANAVDHLACATHNGFSYATVEAPLIIADGIDGRDAVDVSIQGFDHFDSVRIGTAAVHADAMVVVTHVKGHEATGMGGALKNVGMGLGCRSAKQRMHSDLKPQVGAEKCIACGRCVKWCPVSAIDIGPDRIARIDHELCYGCGECVASCSYGAIAIQWTTEPDAIQEKIVEHAAGALAAKNGKVVFLSFVMNVSPDCDCWHFSDASVVSDIGVLASTDIVAIDQAAYDLITSARGLPGTRGEGMVEGIDKLHEITGVDPTLGLGYAEAHGLGTRAYSLRILD